MAPSAPARAGALAGRKKSREGSHDIPVRAFELGRLGGHLLVDPLARPDLIRS